MKYLFYVLLLLSLIACEKEAVISCLENASHPTWASERFKDNYDIQLPANYDGIGMAGFEGYFFLKYRQDSLVEFRYNYCGPLYCEPYGDTLTSPSPNFIVATNQMGDSVNLASIQEFCNQGEVIGLLYHDNIANATGRYFMKVDNQFLEGLEIYFDTKELQEVKDVINTIVEQ